MAVWGIRRESFFTSHERHVTQVEHRTCVYTPRVQAKGFAPVQGLRSIDTLF